MNIRGDQIQHIDEKGLTYVDGFGNTAFIDFAQCYTNYWKEWTSREHLDRFKEVNNMNDDQLHAWLKRHEDWKEVARRDVTGWMSETKMPFIEFHTVPPIQFVFDSPEALSRVRFEIESFGWRTYDLS